MSDEIKLNKAVENAARAEAYLRDEFLTELENTRISELFEGWKNTAPSDTDGRERIFRQYHEVRKFRDILARLAANGRLAQAELNALAAKAAAEPKQ